MSPTTRRVALVAKGHCLDLRTTVILHLLTRLLVWVIQRSWQLSAMTMRITSGLKVTGFFLFFFVVVLFVFVGLCYAVYFMQDREIHESCLFFGCFGFWFLNNGFTSNVLMDFSGGLFYF